MNSVYPENSIKYYRSCLDNYLIAIDDRVWIVSRSDNAVYVVSGLIHNIDVEISFANLPTDVQQIIIESSLNYE